MVLNSNSESQKGVPLLSKIPIIGNLFKNKGEIEEKSQMVIYLVPHIENKKIEESSTEYKLGNKSESWLYEKLENLEKLAKLKE